MKFRPGDVVMLCEQNHGASTVKEYGEFVVKRCEMQKDPFHADSIREVVFVINKRKGWDGSTSLLAKQLVIKRRARKITLNTRRNYE